MREIKLKTIKKCIHCHHAKFCRRHSKISLIERDSLHSCMWINQHIHTAYRPLDLPWNMCIKRYINLYLLILNIFIKDITLDIQF